MSKRGCLRSRKSRIIVSIVIFLVICAVIIPSVVVTELHKKNSMGPKSKIIVPLYVYPAPGAWNPLEDVYVSIFIAAQTPPTFFSDFLAISFPPETGSPPHRRLEVSNPCQTSRPHEKFANGTRRKKKQALNSSRISAHPDVNFTVVINPGSGPGPNALPDANYTREIPILASYENVRLLGYVHTSYAERNVSLVRRDIETYAAWPIASSNRGLAVRGIFFDETPQQYSDHAFAYLQNLTELVKNSNGFGSDAYVSFNLLLSFCLVVLVICLLTWLPLHPCSDPMPISWPSFGPAMMLT